MTDPIIVTHYGIHRSDEGIVYLHQGNGKAMNFIGLSARSPFEVRATDQKQRACPHLINGTCPMPDREHWATFMQVYKDELLQEFLPIPRRHRDLIPFVDGAEADDMLLFLLSKLSSPIYPTVFRFDKYPRNKFEASMMITNLAPIVLTHIRPEHQAELEEMCSLARRAPRKLILSGDKNMVIREPMKRVRTVLQHFPEAQLYSLPMETLGAVSLRRWARGEQIDGPWDRYAA